MEITPNSAALRPEEPLSKIYQERLKASAETSSAAESANNESKLAENEPTGGDTVSISEEAYKKQQEAEKASSEPGATRFAGAKEEEEPAPADLKEILRRQIREVQKQLNEARQRLAAAMAEQGQGNAGETPVEAPEEADAGNGKQADGGDEVKKCTAEVGQLTATLLQLNNQLMKEEKKASQAGAMGSAGISTGGTGERGGLGERMVTRA